jgi:SAM-dependent methyltransferase
MPSPAPLSHSLDLLQDTYNYNHWIYSLLRPYLGDCLLEVGSGIGNMTPFFLGCREIVGLEPETEYADRLAELAAIHLNFRVVQAGVEDIPSTPVPEGHFDTVVCINVLEHVPRHVEAVARMKAAVRPGGRILLYVPACPWAYGAMDQALGHLRRYSAASLRALLAEAGLTLVHSRYVNFVGLWGWWWAGRIRRESLIDPRKARLVDRMVPLLSAAERLIHPPVGQSLFMVAERPR